jgi:hypothetical protein
MNARPASGDYTPTFTGGTIKMKRVAASLGMMLAGLMPLAATLILLTQQH